ncbi:MAG: ABC transporter permease [Cytophagales bacterium]|nr:ABC transporter permease [Cytophagales bacterium]
MTHSNAPAPPRLARRLLQWRCPADQLEELEGDLEELFRGWAGEVGLARARRRYWFHVLGFLRPVPFRSRAAPRDSRAARCHPLTPFDMLSNYFTIAWRNMRRHKGYAAINIGGLAVGMAVALLIGLWVWDELSYNQYFRNYDRIGQVMLQGGVNGKVFTGEYMPVPLGQALRTDYAPDLEHVVMSSWMKEHILAYGDKKFTRTGSYLSPEVTQMLSPRMLAGPRDGLREPASVMLSQSVARALFGTEDPLNKTIRIDHKVDVKVTGVYEDFPFNTGFRDMTFMAPWQLYISTDGYVRQAQDDWNNTSWQILVQLAPRADFNTVSDKIKNTLAAHLPPSTPFKPALLLHPMSKWHLYAAWDKTGKAGGRIEYVWLFGMVGAFVLLLACINFMNLATARSEKRAKEVGIRKTMGSLRGQLIGQFFGESLLVVVFAFAGALLVAATALPFFNGLADKQITLPVTNGYFWAASLLIVLLTALLAGSYPALYLSAFRPVQVLKGAFRAGRRAVGPRKVLVVVQFAVSVTLIIGTLVVFRQVQHAKNRPLGYNTQGVVTVAMNTPELLGQYNTLRGELLATGAVLEMSTSSTPATNLNSHNGGFEWEGKDPAFDANFGTVAVTHDFGKTIGWQFVAGRDFSRTFASDSAGMVLNETGAAYMGLKDPVGKTVKWQGQPYKVIGIIKDMMMGSPYEPVSPTVFILSYYWAGVVNIKLNPALPAQASLAKVATVFKKRSPGSPFDYKFLDAQYAAKFAAEQRVGTLATVFAGLAVLISCLGLFGLASFVAEQRIKEIGIRKVMGASVFTLWSLLSREFVYLVMIAFLVSAPAAYYFLSGWLAQYDYRTEIPGWIFALSGGGALAVTLLTVSYQAIRAATRNPVSTLRSE